MNLDYKTNFQFECVYHIYTHGNANDLLFREKKNYYFFLQKLEKYILPMAKINAYCLLPNHFHLILTFKSKEEIAEANPEVTIPDDNEHKFLMQQFSNFLNSYTKSFNKVYNRKGTLFINFLKRKRIDNEDYLRRCIHYIHNNPVNHGYTNSVESWEFSSYLSYLKPELRSKLDRNFIMSYFDSVEGFITYHNLNIQFPFLD